MPYSEDIHCAPFFDRVESCSVFNMIFWRKGILRVINFIVFFSFVSCLFFAFKPFQANAASVQPEFRSGPVVLADFTAPNEEPIGVIDWESVAGNDFKVKDLRLIRDALNSHGGVLLAGRTDSMGPASLNKSLGLQYALNAAEALSGELSAELWRFSCASLGEVAGEQPGIVVYPFQPKMDHPGTLDRLFVKLAPPKHSGDSADLYAFWARGAIEVLLGVDGDGGTLVWELSSLENPVYLPFSVYSTNIALGAGYGDGSAYSADLRPPHAVNDDSLRLRLDHEEGWTAHLVAEIPKGYASAVAWVSGIPYFVGTPVEGRADIEAALMPNGNTAYLQAIDPRGGVVAGPVVALPDGPTKSPELLAVLIWENEAVDLDLHAWSDGGHTFQEDPDSELSADAVPGTRLLFDGNGFKKASALLAWKAEGFSLDARCFGAMGGGGTRAWIHLISYPGDPLRQRHRLLGPRRMSERPLEQRWPFYPALNADGGVDSY